MTSETLTIDTLAVKASRTHGVFLQGQVRGEMIYMPLSLESARLIAENLLAAANAVAQIGPSGDRLH